MNLFHELLFLGWLIGVQNMPLDPNLAIFLNFKKMCQKKEGNRPNCLEKV